MFLIFVFLKLLFFLDEKMPVAESYFFLIAFFSFAQEEVLFTIDGQSLYEGEFVHSYNKNLSLIKDKGKSKIEDYLNRLIDYKLKVVKAEAEKLDITNSFQTQYQKYKNELTQKYMMDTEVSEHLLYEAYQRKKTEINASHIMIRVPSDAAPKDTLRAYHKIREIQNKLKKGTSFEKLAFRYSEDPSAKHNKGNLGWFGVFKMVYPFENAAYNTPVGQVSDPVRSKFGYHLVKVNEKRKSRGNVQIAQILIKTGKDFAVFDAKTRIDDIKQKLENGADFANMAKQYSDDKSTAAQGGIMRSFDPIDLHNTKVEDIIDQLSVENPVSKPFKIKRNWHIIKLMHRYALKNFEEEKKSLQNLIKRSGRSAMIRDSLINKLKQEYTLEEIKPGVDYFKNKLGDLLFVPTEENLPQTPILRIQDDEISYQEFLEVLKKHKDFKKNELSPEILDNLFADFKDDQLVAYQKRHLPEHNLKLKRTINDFHDGLLIYALMENHVWMPSKSDSLAIVKYYKTHREDFKSPTKYDVEIVTSDNKKSIRAVRRELKQGQSVELLKNTHKNILIDTGSFKRSNPKLPQKIKQKPGVSRISKHNGVFMVVKTKKVRPPHQENYEKVKEKVMRRYQKKSEKEFIQDLHHKYQVEINQNTLKKIITEFE